MKKFAAKELDLSAEVVTINGDSVMLIPRNPRMSGRDVEVLSMKLSEIEDPKRKNRKEGLPLAAEELALIYDKDAQWFAEEIDFGTMREIMAWFIEVLGEYGKGKSS